MWKIEPSDGNRLLPPKIVLDEAQYGKGLPKGNSGGRKDGFIFKELVRIKDLGGNKYEAVLDHITAEITKKPVLVAVTPEQLKNWQGKIIVAQPAAFTWVSD